MGYISDTGIPHYSALYLAGLFHYIGIGCLFFSVLLHNCKSHYLSVYSHWPTRLSLDGFSWNLAFDYFSKIC